MQSPATHPVEKISEAMVCLGVSLAVLAHLVFAIELIEWLLMGQWPGWSVEDGLLFVGIERPLAQFSIVQFAADIATDLPLALGIYLGGLGLFYAALKLEPQHQAQA